MRWDCVIRCVSLTDIFASGYRANQVLSVENERIKQQVSQSTRYASDRHQEPADFVNPNKKRSMMPTVQRYLRHPCFSETD